MLILLSLLTSVLDSFSNLLNKKTTNRISDLDFVWLISLFTLPFFVAGLFIFESNFKFNFSLNFLLLLACGIIALFGARILLRKAYDTIDLSLVSPITGFTPIFSLLIGIFVLNEIPSTLGYLGIFCIFLGCLITNLNRNLNDSNSLKGIYYTLGSDLLYSLYFLICKIGSQQVGIFTWLVMLHGTISTTYFVSILFRRKLPSQNIFSTIKVMLLYGLFNSFSVIISLFLISQIYLAYFTSLMQIYILVDVFLGHFVLKENGFIKRLAGTAVIFTGLIMVSLFG